MTSDTRGRRWRRLLALVAVGSWPVWVPAVPAAAHETTSAGPVRLSIGWATEPAYTGLLNSVEVDVSDETGTPLPDAAASLSVEVAFGPETQILTLAPTGAPGELRAALLPTRAGTYAFNVHGTVMGQAVDATSTCSESTFDCVLDVAEIQFPAKDPSLGQVADRLARERQRASQARADASEARWLALAAVALAVGAVAMAAVVGMRSRRAARRS